MSDMDEVHVMVGVIRNSTSQVLIAQRPQHVHQGGLWEFPGGKVETGETAHQALNRELYEELGITVRSSQPFLKISHQYPDKKVLLDVWMINDFSGEPIGIEGKGKEGQPLQWISSNTLQQFDFPQANIPIINALQLPSYYIITPAKIDQPSEFLRQLEQCINQRKSILQFRVKQITGISWEDLLRQAQLLCRQSDTQLVINVSSIHAIPEQCDGVHLSSTALMSCKERPISNSHWLGASCHNQEELQHAAKIGVDFAVLGAVHKTLSHPDSEVLGWKRFKALVDDVAFPVYALGGMLLTDKTIAVENGAQGIAAISAFWQQGGDNG